MRTPSIGMEGRLLRKNRFGQGRGEKSRSGERNQEFYLDLLNLRCLYPNGDPKWEIVHTSLEETLGLEVYFYKST